MNCIQTRFKYILFVTNHYRNFYYIIKLNTGYFIYGKYITGYFLVSDLTIS